MKRNSEKINVLFDAQAFDLQTHGGVSRCFVELSKHLPEWVEGRMAICETDNVYLRDSGYKSSGSTYRSFTCLDDGKFKWLLYKLYQNIKHGKWNRLTCRPQLNLFETERLMNEWDFDVFHPTFFDPSFLPALEKTGKPFVLTVHDMISELYPQYFPPHAKFLKDKKELIQKANHIVAVSHQTKKDIVRLMGVPEERITVVYHGADEAPYVPTPDFSLGYEYVLFVGARSLYKNFAPFVHAMKSVLTAHPQMKVVCTGVPFTTEELQLLSSLGIEDHFVQLFAKDDQQLSDLYHHAVCFVYPSEYEGFGIPILEAWRAECPVVLNNIPVFREVADSAATYVNIDAMGGNLAQAVESIYSMSKAEKDRLISVQNERLHEFTWTRAASQLADVYKKVLS